MRFGTINYNNKVTEQLGVHYINTNMPTKPKNFSGYAQYWIRVIIIRRKFIIIIIIIIIFSVGKFYLRHARVYESSVRLANTLSD